jgi:DNA-binding CsgD family transcriptional regulator
MRDFFAAGGHAPETNFRVAADDGQSVLKVTDERAYDEVKAGLASDDFVDFCEQYDMVHGCQTVLLRENDSLLGMSLLRARSDGRTTERARGVFAEAALSAAKAVRLQRAIEHQGSHLLAGTFEAMASACVIFDGRARVRAMSSAAERYVGPSKILMLNDGQLDARDAALSRALYKAIHAATGAANTRYARLVGRDAAKQAVAVEIFGLPPRPWSTLYAPRAIAVIRSVGEMPNDASDRLISAFGFTRAEAAVAVLLCQGLSRDQITARRGVRPETLRSQLRAIYSKAACNREAEFVLLAHDVLR